MSEDYKKLFEDLQADYDLFRKITLPNDDAKLAIDLSKIEKMIHETLPDEIEQLAPPHFPQLYFDIKYEYSRLRDFIVFEPLIGKQIVALGGGFSSGKSSFLNSLLNDRVLPADINPSTSIPTYLVHHEAIEVQGVNVFDAKLDLEPTDMRKIAHGFGEVKNEDFEGFTESAALGHIMKNIFYSTPQQPYENIAFLDTPGYSKSDMATYSAKTDEKIARVQLNSSDCILWFIPADGGTITEQDIHFIQSLKKEIPKLMIVNKADKKTPEDLHDIVQKIKKVLDLKGISYLDVLTYSNRKRNPYDSEAITRQLDQWNKAVHKEKFAYNFKTLFVDCKDYYEEQITAENKRLNRLNIALTLATEDIIEYLQSLVLEIKHRLHKLESIREKVKVLQNDFFTELKQIADQVGIEMPEPSEIDLIQDKVQNPLQVIQAYNSQHQIKPAYDASIIIHNTLAGIEPKFYEQVGQGNYDKQLARIIHDNLQVAREEIRFNDYVTK